MDRTTSRSVSSAARSFFHRARSARSRAIFFALVLVQRAAALRLPSSPRSTKPKRRRRRRLPPALGELDQPSRQAPTNLPLNATLGECVAGQRLRHVETALEEPANAISPIDPLTSSADSTPPNRNPSPTPSRRSYFSCAGNLGSISPA